MQPLLFGLQHLGLYQVNLAICLNEDFIYGIYETNKGNLILAKELAENVFKELNLSYNLIKEIKGKDLEYLEYKHPLYDRISPIITGEHVTNDAGTGCVHTAPGHGVDDYNVSLKYNLGLLSPVDNKGHMTNQAPFYEGMFYKKANKYIMEDLNKNDFFISD